MTTFQEMGLPETLINSLNEIQFKEPTQIQAQAIPFALEGRDILGSAQTGTGKTGAFSIPLVAKILSDSTSAALVIAPTRELAVQVMGQIQNLLGKKSEVKTALLIGGEPMPQQILRLKNRPRVVVGTPGRINDHIRQKNLKLNETNFLVLDEIDRMLDMGFTIQIDEIMKHLTKERQTLLFSATLPKHIVHIAEKYLNNPVRVSVSTECAPANNITQDIQHISEAEKYNALVTQINDRQGSIIVFVKTKNDATKMAIKLLKEGHSADAIHGDLRQNKRTSVIMGFRKQKYRILVATDIAARGLDIPHIEHVINYDLPQCAEDYIHRIGRTARAGAEGFVLNLVTPFDRKKWDAIERLLNPELKKIRPSNNNQRRGRNDYKKEGSFGGRSSDGQGQRKQRGEKWGNEKWGSNKPTSGGAYAGNGSGNGARKSRPATANAKTNRFASSKKYA